MKEYIVEIISILIALVTLIVSIYANIIAKKSNKLAKKSNKIADEANEKADEANDIAENALNESQKEYMPLIKMVGEINVKRKTFFELQNEITFDFSSRLFDRFDFYKKDDFEDFSYSQIELDDELVCISSTIKNVGNGVVTALAIKDFFIQNCNKFSVDIRSQEEFDTLCLLEQYRCEQEFILLPNEEIEINFLITDEVMNREYGYFDYAEKRIEEYFENNKEYNIMLGISIDISSINKSSYKQTDLNATYVNGQVMHNSLGKIEPNPKVKVQKSEEKKKA